MAHTLVTKANLSGYKLELGQSRCLYHCVYVWVKKWGTQYNVMCVGKAREANHRHVISHKSGREC